MKIKSGQPIAIPLRVPASFKSPEGRVEVSRRQDRVNRLLTPVEAGATVAAQALG